MSRLLAPEQLTVVLMRVCLCLQAASPGEIVLAQASWLPLSPSLSSFTIVPSPRSRDYHFASFLFVLSVPAHWYPYLYYSTVPVLRGVALHDLTSVNLMLLLQPVLCVTLN
jgi:hypothetical protein